jgi:hypothetical protein
MIMGLNHAVFGYPQTEWRVPSKSLPRHEYALDNELENRIKNLDKLVDSLHATPNPMCFSRKPHALDLVNDLRTKIKASNNLLRVAKLLSEPARESMFSKLRDSLNDLEEVIASHLGVKTN